MKKYKNTWKRTGKTRQEFSFNKKGVITLETEVNQKGWTREVQTAYTTIIEEGDK